MKCRFSGPAQLSVKAENQMSQGNEIDDAVTDGG